MTLCFNSLTFLAKRRHFFANAWHFLLLLWHLRHSLVLELESWARGSDCPDLEPSLVVVVSCKTVAVKSDSAGSSQSGGSDSIFCFFESWGTDKTSLLIYGKSYTNDYSKLHIIRVKSVLFTYFTLCSLCQFFWAGWECRST